MSHTVEDGIREGREYVESLERLKAEHPDSRYTGSRWVSDSLTLDQCTGASVMVAAGGDSPLGPEVTLLPYREVGNVRLYSREDHPLTLSEPSELLALVRARQGGFVADALFVAEKAQAELRLWEVWAEDLLQLPGARAGTLAPSKLRRELVERIRRMKGASS